MRRFGRRLITIPCYVILFAMAVSTLPLTLLVAATVDVAKRTPWGVTRSVLFFTWYLLCEVSGIIISFFPWLLYRFGFRMARERYVSWHYRLESWWARMLLAGATKIFGMHFEIEGDDDLGPGPAALGGNVVQVGQHVGCDLDGDLFLEVSVSTWHGSFPFPAYLWPTGPQQPAGTGLCGGSEPVSALNRPA